jgi:hypothetical protein
MTENRQFHSFIMITMILTVGHDSAVRWDLRHSKQAPRMRSALAKDFAQQFGRAVGDDVWLRTLRCTVHQHHELHNACNFVQISDGGLQCGNQLYQRCHPPQGVNTRQSNLRILNRSYTDVI